MKTLTLSKDGRTFVVDDRSKTGSPACGRGKTMKEAIGDYFFNNREEFDFDFEVDETARPAEMRRRARELAKR
jgi:hypothetical protein